jgi:hypothetical protein
MANISIDARSLSIPGFSIAGVGTFSTSSVELVDLAPGTYIVGTVGSPAFEFKVDASGRVDYDVSLDTFVAGRGTTTLTVTGFQLTIDATGLTIPDFQLADAASGAGVAVRPTTAAQTGPAGPRHLHLRHPGLAHRFPVQLGRRGPGRLLRLVGHPRCRPGDRHPHRQGCPGHNRRHRPH